MDFKGNDILTLEHYSRKELDFILDTATDFEEIAAGKTKSKLLEGKILATLFFEPSTRTKNSHEAAMLRLGGGIIGFDNISSTSVAKGESFEDTVKTFSLYSDVIVVRHPEIGSAHRAAEAASVPVINGGDGSNQHPTQGLLDLYTIRKEKGSIDGLEVALVGDVKHTRSFHSVTYGLSRYDVKIYFVAPPQLQLLKEIEDELLERGVRFEKASKLTEVIDKVDVVYISRLQEERFPNREEAKQFRGAYTLDPKWLDEAKDDMIVMHHLPRLWEIPVEIDDTPYARYFQQEYNGLVVRCALLSLVLGMAG
jgi:aspartate carbamoyltransferase catalytic subunit